MANNNFLNNIPPVTKHLLLVNILIWIISSLLLHTQGFDLDKYLGLHYVKSPDFNPAQIITYMFMHDNRGIAHIFFNMFSLYMFGRLLEQVFGSKRYLFYYISTGIGAAAIQLLVIHLQIGSVEKLLSPEMISVVYAEGADALEQGLNFVNPNMAELNALINTSIVGASGAVFGILLAFGMIFPNIPLYIFFIPVPIKAKYVVIGYGLLELLFGISGTMSGVAHFAHLGGMIFGIIMILYWRKKGIIGGRYY
ncbi:MAG: rhomboid family intramembrane serine protease [Bacteroidetes bacterium]|uniref:Rhomboid family intramembrane serine protease n=1 Tax=Candidatus Limisoma faecipullorum TaxID=2840854 RepID=A0A9D9IR63_9BACT|nr:rhomboid family intramembrane serine protease [Candidatus Limisoma faecipullorum]